MNISENGLNLIKSFEHCRLRAFKNDGGEWIIGYGWKRPIDGLELHEGMIITKAKANELLLKMIGRYELQLTDVITVEIGQRQFDALMSLACSIGSKAFTASSLLQKLNAGDQEGAAEEFLSWSDLPGRWTPFEQRRRIVERELFLS
ncbi:MAG: lysozyme [Serratia sp. (in: enterobacteria)]|uniref:lysozyme n=1 Tax=Serratia sp. (in: enterobacteria) TaxID=616 RepID=UPI003F307409